MAWVLSTFENLITRSSKALLFFSFVKPDGKTLDGSRGMISFNTEINSNGEAKVLFNSKSSRL